MRWPEDIWEDIAKGDLTGYSVGGTGVRLALEQVGKAGKWAPGPNAGWRRADGGDGRVTATGNRVRPRTYHSDELGEVTTPESDHSAARPEDEERDEELRRSRARSTKPKESAEDAYAAATLRSFDLVDDIEESLQDRQAPSDDFQPDWADAGSAEEIDNRLGAVLGFLSGDEDAYARDQTKPTKFKTAEDAYSARMLSAFHRAEQIRDLVQDQRAPGDDFAPDWEHVGSANEVSRRLEEALSFITPQKSTTSEDPWDRPAPPEPYYWSAKPKRDPKEPTRPTGNTYFWGQKRANPEPSADEIDKAVREGLRDAVAKHGTHDQASHGNWRQGCGRLAPPRSAEWIQTPRRRPGSALATLHTVEQRLGTVPTPALTSSTARPLLGARRRTTSADWPTGHSVEARSRRSPGPPHREVRKRHQGRGRLAGRFSADPSTGPSRKHGTHDQSTHGNWARAAREVPGDS